MNRKMQFALAVLLVAGLIWFLYRMRRTDAAICVVKRVEERGDVRVEIVNDECKEGLPHTTGPKTVRMSEEKWDSEDQGRILKHEYVHLSQKQKPEEWRRFYKQAWGYDLLTRPPPEIPQGLVYQLRPNPDTDDAPWALWQGKYLFFPTFAYSERRLKNAKVIVWNMQTHQQTQPPEEWQKFFCERGRCPHQFEHPHELAAELHTEKYSTPAATNLQDFLHYLKKLHTK